MEELLYARHLQSVHNPLDDCDQEQAATVLLMGDIRAYQSAYSCRIDIWNVGEIQNERAGRIGAHQGLEIE